MSSERFESSPKSYKFFNSDSTLAILNNPASSHGQTFSLPSAKIKIISAHNGISRKYLLEASIDFDLLNT